MAASALMMNWSESVDSAILLARVTSSILMWRWGSRTCKELSSEVSTESLQESTLAGPMLGPGHGSRLDHNLGETFASKPVGGKDIGVS